MSVRIRQHCLSEARFEPSPHADARPDEQDINLLVVHCISLPEGRFGEPYIHDLFMGQLDSSAHPDFAILKGLRVSAHVVIRRDGEVVQYVPFNQRAWHAGKSWYCGRRRCNDFSIGIELEGTDYQSYTEQQYQQLVQIAAALMHTYPALNRRRIVGHQHIAPGRKTDPGPGFDWHHFHTLLTAELAGSTSA
ncbi:MAG: 1,6-anhydro-N-acetylmuramyl-L-alanine amidase AmpD [Idiomarina sp.]